MESFKVEFDKIYAACYPENAFDAFMKQKDIFAQNPLILYGCGYICGTVVSVCNNNGIKITALCDTYKTGSYGDKGLEIITPERLKEEYPDANVIVCTYQFADEIKEKLYALGFSEKQIYPPLSTVNFMSPSDFIRDYLEGYELAYDFYNDDISKQLLLDRIRMYFMGTELQKSSDAPQYFEPGIINLDANEVFADCGGFTGDTAEEFIKQIKNGNKGEYRHIYSFEPDLPARENAIKNLEKYENVDVIGKGLWSRETNLEFFSDGGNSSSSFVRGDRTILVPVTSIDSFFAGRPDDELPTFIKMDIEGSEKEALIGAANVIRKKHPKLAICAYHRREDVYELPKLIHELDPSYQFYLRQYIDGIFETVLYAV